MKELLDQLSDEADVVVVDSAPILPVADAAVLAPVVDGVLLVLRAGKSRREAAQQAVERLNQAGANLVGVVLNAMPTPDDVYYWQYTKPEEEKGGSPERRQLEPLAALGQWFRQTVAGLNLWVKEGREDRHA
jgi:Mrp family chromosome partitioning ATPase